MPKSIFLNRPRATEREGESVGQKLFFLIFDKLILGLMVAVLGLGANFLISQQQAKDQQVANISKVYSDILVEERKNACLSA